VKRPWAAAAGATALTSLLFVVAYNACNDITHARTDVGVWAFDWERHWPVVPAMIVPYWSIDLLFLLAPFCCTTRDEVDVHRRRLVFAIAGASLGFLLIPLRFAFPRPEVEGALAPGFAALYSFDQPHNLFPSLHIAFRTLLADLYVRQSRGAWRLLAHGWFSLVGVSTLLTWQHHLVDVLGGFWLAALAVQLFRFETATPPPAVNRTVTLCYAAGAVLCTQLARLAWPWTFVFVWPAFALGAAAFGYAGHGSIYRKIDGRLTVATRLLFAPVLAGQWVSWWYYRRQSTPWSELAPRVWIGSVLRDAEARDAIAAGVTALVDLTVEFSEPRAFGAVRYLPVPVLDLTAPTQAQLHEAVAFIERESADGIVFIHCKAGYSRTAGAAGAWLLASGRASDVADACRQLIAARPRIVIRPEIREALASFHRPARGRT
jgi:protein-tyrosine phosphatase/membrane-associated phospholipid phosphatase